jgi:hypothetical protein
MFARQLSFFCGVQFGLSVANWKDVDFHTNGARVMYCSLTATCREHIRVTTSIA